jgi:hypothetical protein
MKRHEYRGRSFASQPPGIPASQHPAKPDTHGHISPDDRVKKWKDSVTGKCKKDDNTTSSRESAFNQKVASDHFSCRCTDADEIQCIRIRTGTIYTVRN